MRHEKIIQRENGDTVKLITLITTNVFVQAGYEIEQFALVKKVGCEEWTSYYHEYTPKSIGREEYMTNHRPKTLLGVISIGESLKAGIEAREEFFENN